MCGSESRRIPPPTVTSCPLICEVFRRATALGWSNGVLASKLHVDRTTLAHIRSGKKIQIDVLSRIVLLFPGDPVMYDLVMAYLLVTVAAQNGGDTPGTSSRTQETLLAAKLGSASARSIEGYVRGFRELALAGEGRVVESGSAAALSTAVDYAGLLAERYGVGTLRVRAASPLLPSLADAALKVPLLLVERVDFACPKVTRLLLQRAAAGKSVLATSAACVSHLADARLRGALRSTTRRITLVHAIARRPVLVALPPPAHANAA